MFDSLKGKISDKETTFFTVPQGKSYLVKSITICNGSEDFDTTFSVYTKDAGKNVYIAPNGLDLKVGEYFVFEVEFKAKAGESLYAKINSYQYVSLEEVPWVIDKEFLSYHYSGLLKSDSIISSFFLMI